MSDFIGKTIGEYQLIELLTEDEQVLQFKAFHPGEERYVNFTMLKPDAANDSFYRQQFLNAAEIAAGTAHTNILPLLDYGQKEDVVYRVSPLAEYGTLRDHRGWFYNLENANMLFFHIINGLAYIYAHGHIHGNLKSSNIFLKKDLSPMLAGFGISQPPGRTESPYISPEQIQGGVIDQQADVYALGVLLYEFLTGVTPPVGIVVKPSSMRQDLPQAVDQVVLKAMAQNPAQRFQNPDEFMNALQNAVKGITSQPPAAEPPPTPAPSVSQSVNVQQPQKRTNWVAIILGIVLVGILIGGAFLIIPPLLEDDDVAEVTEEPPIEEPTAPPVEQPTEPPIEQPTEPPAEQPPGEDPTEDPQSPGSELPEGLPDFCYSIGFAAGIAVFGITVAAKKHKKNTFQDW